MEITVHNYEVFAVDYLDGKLDALQKAQFILFLEEHPKIKEELSQLSDVVLERSHIVYEAKASLKKTELIPADDLLLIRNLEGDLNAEEYALLHARLQQESTLAKNLSIYEKTILQPDLAIIYEDKSDLKHGNAFRFRWIYAAAAVFLIAFILPFVTNNTNKHSQTALHLKKENPKKDVTLPSETNAEVNIKAVSVSQEDAPKSKSNLTIRSKVETHDVMQMAVKPASVIETTATINEPKTNESIAMLDEKSMLKNTETTNASTVESTDKNDFLTPTEYIVANINKSVSSVVIEENKPSEKTSNKLNLVGIALKAYIGISGKNVQLKKKYNDQGEVTSVALLSENFEYSKSR